MPAFRSLGVNFKYYVRIIVLTRLFFFTPWDDLSKRIIEVINFRRGSWIFNAVCPYPYERGEPVQIFEIAKKASSDNLLVRGWFKICLLLTMWIL